MERPILKNERKYRKKMQNENGTPKFSPAPNNVPLNGATSSWWFLALAILLAFFVFILLAVGDADAQTLTLPLAVSTCGPITLSAHYQLTTDLYCTAQPVSINADDIDLNLNGHTIYYGNPVTVVPGIAACDTWYKGPPGWVSSNCGGNGHHNRMNVYGGTIKQLPGTKGFSHGVHVGQANGDAAGKIHDLLIIVQETGAKPINCESCGAGWEVYNNAIVDNVTNIQFDGQSALSARSAFQGSAISFGPYTLGGWPGAGNYIHDNLIEGTPQGGIVDFYQGTRIFDNTVNMSSRYSNDYAVTSLVNYQDIENNGCSGSGRCYDVEGSYTVLRHNRGHAHGNSNSEYPNCAQVGDILRIKNYTNNPPSVGLLIDDNTFIAEATECPGAAIRITNLSSAAQVTIKNNRFIGTGPLQSYAISMEGADTSNISFTQNMFVGDTFIDWDGAHFYIGVGQSWIGLVNVFDGDGGTSAGQFFNIGDNPPATVVCGAHSSVLVTVGDVVRQCPK